MKTIKQTRKHTLKQGFSMARGLYNVSDEDDNLSYWFGMDQMQELMDLDDEQFDRECERLINES